MARNSAVNEEAKATSYKRCKTQTGLTGARDVIVADSRRFWVGFRKVFQVESACSSIVWLGFVQFPRLAGESKLPVGVNV